MIALWKIAHALMMLLLTITKFVTFSSSLLKRGNPCQSALGQLLTISSLYGFAQPDLPTHLVKFYQFLVRAFTLIPEYNFIVLSISTR